MTLLETATVEQIVAELERRELMPGPAAPPRALICYPLGKHMPGRPVAYVMTTDPAREMITMVKFRSA